MSKKGPSAPPWRTTLCVPVHGVRPLLALLKSQNALKMGCFGTKNGSKPRFSKHDLRPFGVSKQVK